MAGIASLHGLKRFSGSMDASLRKGQFVEVEGSAQALRVFGLLNFNAISRRLRLDFSDILGKGLSYDRVKGFSPPPTASTSPAAAEAGRAVEQPGVERYPGPGSRSDRRQAAGDLAIDQQPDLAALIVGGPAVGSAVFVVDKLLGDRVSRFASVQYSVKGPWRDPKISFDKPFRKPR